MFLEPERHARLQIGDAGRPASRGLTARMSAICAGVVAMVAAALTVSSQTSELALLESEGPRDPVEQSGPAAGPPAQSRAPLPQPPVMARPTASAATLMLIEASFGEAVVLHDVVAAGAGSQTYCGQVSSAERPQRVRFVWLASVRMVATDDGGADFAEVARACDG